MPSTALVRSQSRVDNWSNETDWEGDQEGYLPVHRLRTQYLDYLGTKVEEYEEQKVARHYYHGAQWTPDEIKILRQRRQPIITFNRISRKVDSIVSLAQRLRQEPKGYPRTPKSDSGAEVATQCIRTVLDGMNWRNLDFMSCRQAAIDGIGGIELKLIQGDHDDPDVGGDIIFGDDFFYDYHSYKPDFGDASYMGVAKWIDVDIAVSLFPDKEEELEDLIGAGSDLTTHSDREFKWVQSQQRRLRLVEHWYKHRGKWYWAFYVSNFLIDQGVSPFLDERKRPMCRFIMFSAGVDHDGDRYGFVRNLKGPQDETNQRRSKALHISNSRRIIISKGAVDDVETARREWTRPDGVVEVNPGFEDKIKPDDQQPDLAAQLQLMQDARQEIDSFANINPALMAQSDTPDDHSGVAINLLQKAGIAEIGSFLLAYRDWKIRVYRAIWNIVVRTWREERWIRVTDDQGVTSFLQINGTGIGEFGQPIIVNYLGALDVDIILDEGPDEINMMHDSLMTLNSLGPQFAQQFPELAIELSPLQGSVKRTMLDKIAQAKQAQSQQGDPKAQTEMIKAQATVASSQAQVKVAEVKANAETFNAQQDALSRQQDMQIEQMDARNRERQIVMQAAYDAQRHRDKMEELAAQKAERARMRRERATQPRRAGAK